MNLPPLPDPNVKSLQEIDWNEFAPVGSYSAEAMTAYAAEAVRVALEQAAQAAEAAGLAACDSFGDGAECIATGERCAEAIRALADKP